MAATLTALQAEGIEVTRPVSDQGWGLLTAITLPGGVELGSTSPRRRQAVGECTGSYLSTATPSLRVQY